MKKTKRIYYRRTSESVIEKYLKKMKILSKESAKLRRIIEQSQ